MKEAVEVVLVVAMVVVMSEWARVVHVNKMQRQDSHHYTIATNLNQSQVHSLTEFLSFYSSPPTLPLHTTRTTIVATAADTGCLSQEAD